MIRNKKVLTIGSFSTMFFLGVGTVIIGASSRNIGLTPSQIGLMVSVQNVGFILSVITVGTLADTYDKARLLAAASLILAVSFYFFYYKDPFFLNLFIMLIIEISIGGYEGAADPMLLDLHKKRQSLIISINHFFVSFGELLISFALTAFFMTILLLTTPGRTMMYILLFLSGVTISIIFPLVITLTGLKYPRFSGTALGILKLGIPVGGIVIPFLISVLAGAVSFQVSLILFSLFAVIGFLLVYANRALLKIEI